MYKLKEILELSPSNNIRTFWMRFKDTEQSLYIRVNVKTRKCQVTTCLNYKGSCWISLGSEFKPYYQETYWHSYNSQYQKSPVFGYNKKVQTAVCAMVNDFIKTNYLCQ